MTSEHLVCITENGESYCVWVPIPELPRPIPVHDLLLGQGGEITGELIAGYWGTQCIQRLIDRQEVCTA